MSSRFPSHCYDELEGIASFLEAIGEPVCPDMKFPQIGNSNRVQVYSNEYVEDA